MLAGVPEPRLLLGLCSGTSADGVDVAVVRIAGRGGQRRVESCGGATVPFPEELRDRIHRAGGGRPDGCARLHGELAECFAGAAHTVLRELGADPSELTAVGSHGQTVFHHDGDPSDGTWQLGDLAVLADRLGVPVVGDFRWSDLAAGGEGAPVSPFADWVLHRRAAASLAVLNLGGIGNLTLLAGEEPPRAWDSGPANGPLDCLVRAETGQACDTDGRLARAGSVIPALLEELQADPFFARPVPRSTGLERFGAALAKRLRMAAPQAELADLLATAVELAAWAVAGSLAAAAWREGPIFVCGGGARNPALIDALGRHLGPSRPLRAYRELGWDPDLREAVAFALLADAFLCREPASWPSTTGVRAPAVLGRWTPPPVP